MYVGMYVCVYVRVYVCVYVSVYVCVYVSVYVCVCACYIIYIQYIQFIQYVYCVYNYVDNMTSHKIIYNQMQSNVQSNLWYTVHHHYVYFQLLFGR